MPLLLSIIGCIFALCTDKEWITVPAEQSFHFNLITVNALFGGFLYTNYSLLIGLLDNKIIDKIKNTDIIEKRNCHILRGIVYATISVASGLFIVLVPVGTSAISKVLNCLIINIEIVFMAFLIVYFLLSLYEMSILIKHIHVPKDKKTPEEIDKLKDKIIGKEDHDNQE